MKKLIKTLFSFLIVNICIFTLFSHAQNDNTATLVDGKTFNAKIKTLAAGKSQNYKDYGNKITTIKESKTQPGNSIIKDNISISESLPIRVRYDNDTIYYYTNAKEIYLNSDSSEMFYNFIKLNDISRLKNRDTSNVKNMYNMFAGCYNMTNTSPLKDWDVSNVTNMAGTFVGNENLTDISGLSNWDTKNVTNMASLFHNCKKLSNISALKNWDTSNVTDMHDMFYYCNLKDISPLTNWDTKNVREMGGMFAWSTNLNDISALRNWNTSNVTDMHDMFYSCNSIKNLSAISNRDTSNVTKMDGMFAYNKSLEDISGLSRRNTKRLEDINGIFRGCSSLTYATAISDWDTSNVTNLEFIFEGCSKLTIVDLSNRDTSNVTEMYQMFKDCKKLKTIYAGEGFTTDRVKLSKNDIRDSSTELFDGDTELVGGNGTKYDPSHTDKTYARIDVPQAPGYFTERGTINLNYSEKETESSTSPLEPNRLEYDELDPSEILSNGYSREMNDAYEFAYKNGITTSKNIEKAKMNSPLTRIAMAKMLSYYAINILGQKPDTSKSIKFNDVTDKQNSDYDNAVTLSYQLGIMGQNIKNNNFRPNYEVTRAEFATALSRMLYNIEDGKGKSKYYEPHISKLYDNGIINRTNPNIKEKRGYVMLMLMRSVR